MEQTSSLSPGPSAASYADSAGYSSHDECPPWSGDGITGLCHDPGQRSVLCTLEVHLVESVTQYNIQHNPFLVEHTQVFLHYINMCKIIKL